MYIHVFSEFFETFLVGLHGVYTKIWFAFNMFPTWTGGVWLTKLNLAPVTSNI
jgi:hypothetical protein